MIEIENVDIPEDLPKRRGRPKGSKNKAKIESLPLPFDKPPEKLELGHNVLYYSNGWRVGKLDGFIGQTGRILPFGSIKHINIHQSNLKPIEA